MEPAKRIIVNTTAQYVKALVNICLSLYSTRLILDALNISDYGIFSVVAGTVSMLGFITNALVITTQRYISFHFGRKELSYVKKIFTNSFLLHIVFGLFLALLLICLKPWLFSGVLNIDPERIEVAGQVYIITVFMLITTIVAAPFKALFIARENIVYIAVIEVCDGILRLLMALGLAYVTIDKLQVYAFMMASIQVLNLMAYSIYAFYRFPECSLLQTKDISSQTMKQLIGFAGWTTFAAGTVAARTQGIAIIFNHFMGTVVNAAYGVAAQVNNACLFVCTSVINAMNPQIMKAEGEGDREHMLRLAGQESKYSAILLSIVSIPLLLELPAVLSVWLKEVPPMTVMFCTFILVTCLADLYTTGLHTANQAQGHIRAFTLLTYIPKLLNIPIAWFLISSGHSAKAVMWSILIIEILVSIIRIPYLQCTAGLNVKYYIRQTILPQLPLVATLLSVSWCCTQLWDFQFRFLITIPLSISAGLAVAWHLSLTEDERSFIVRLYREKFKK